MTTEREAAARKALIDRLKLTSAWVFAAMGPTKPGETDPELCPLAAIEDAIAALSASPWLPLPAEVREGEAPWDGGWWLVADAETCKPAAVRWSAKMRVWTSAEGIDSVFRPYLYAEIAPLPPASGRGGVMRHAEKERRVLAALTEPMSGATLGAFSGLSSGQLYPVLFRMEREGKIASAWADGPYPRRRIYRPLPPAADG